MAHTALQVANRIIELGRSKHPPQYYTPMQLLKLVYIAHGWTLGICATPLITEQVEAWKYGPVIPDLYQHVKKYGSSSIFGGVSKSMLKKSRLNFDKIEKCK